MVHESLIHSPIIFADMDGVLNTPETFSRRKVGDSIHVIEPELAGNLKTILESFSGIKVVISSSWRKFCTLDEIVAAIGEWIRPYIHDHWCTPRHDTGLRGVEIKQWFDIAKLWSYDIPYIVIDDDSDIFHFQPFVHTKYCYGLNNEKTQEAIDLLQSEIARLQPK